MCELLGMSFNEPIMPSLSFRGFRHRGKMNRDGWGLAYYPDESVQVFKEPIRADYSHLAEFIKTYPAIKSKIVLAHVRLASMGAKTHKNTHPFHRELYGKDYVFAHNGTLNDFGGFENGRFNPIGKTDSEKAFCHILNLIEKEGIKSWDHAKFKWLHDVLININNHGTFNCIMSDGEYLFCYHDKSLFNGLAFLKREAPFSKVRLQDEDFEIDLAEEKSPSQRGYIVATNPLTDENWVSFKPSELIVFRSGTVVYSSTGCNIDDFSTQPNEKEIKILRVLRESPHRLSLREIGQKCNLPSEELLSSIQSLLCKGYIKQDSRDRVSWDHDESTFFTNPTKRAEIDNLIVTLTHKIRRFRNEIPDLCCLWIQSVALVKKIVSTPQIYC